MIWLLIGIVTVAALVLLGLRGRNSPPPDWRQRTIHYQTSELPSGEATDPPQY